MFHLVKIDRQSSKPSIKSGRSDFSKVLHFFFFQIANLDVQIFISMYANLYTLHTHLRKSERVWVSRFAF